MSGVFFRKKLSNRIEQKTEQKKSQHKLTLMLKRVQSDLDQKLPLSEEGSAFSFWIRW
jgi:hypothetical protein